MHQRFGSSGTLVQDDERKVIWMNKNGTAYEPPKAKAYRFDENDQILTASGGGGSIPMPTPDPTADYATRALNDFMGGNNTTFE